MVESADLEEFNPQGYDIEDAKKSKYKKLENVGGKKGKQKVLSNIDRKQGYLKFINLPADRDQMDQKMVQKVYGEVRMLLKLPHPNFVRVRDAFIMDKKELATCYEWIDGQTIENWMKETRSTDAILDVFAQIVTGFKVLHDHKIMHKNISAKHFMLKQENNATIVKIIGFSKLREMAHDGSVTSGDTLDEQYQAPEICSTGPSGSLAYNRASDIWALGVLLFEMAAKGEKPFESSDSEEIKKETLDEAYLKRCNLPTEIQNILKQIFKVLPEDRSTIGQLRDALKPQVTKYMESSAFKAEWFASRQSMTLIDHQDKLHSVKMTAEKQEEEFVKYMQENLKFP